MIFESYKLRQRRLRGELPDIYTYDDIPKALRVQIIQIMTEVLGGTLDYHLNQSGRDVQTNIRVSYQIIVTLLRKDLGVFSLPHADRSYSNPIHENFLAELTEFLLAEEDVELVLSAVELICEVIENRASKRSYRGRDRAHETSKDAIDEINARFKLHGVGYEYARQIIRVDAELLHAEAVKPALLLLKRSEICGCRARVFKCP